LTAAEGVSLLVVPLPLPVHLAVLAAVHGTIAAAEHLAHLVGSA
jgi:hypothetical protein